MLQFFEGAALFLCGGWGAIKSALKARQMNLSRVNEHGVRVWKSAADSFLAPVTITSLWVLAAFLAMVALVGLLNMASTFQPPQPATPWPPQPVTTWPPQSTTPRPPEPAPVVAPSDDAATTAPADRLSLDGAPAGMILAQSDRRLLTSSDIAQLSVQQLRLARNEIFARRGRVFTDPELRAHFQQFSWYRPTSDEVQLSDVEAANVRFLSEEEERQSARSGGLSPPSEMGPTKPEASDEPVTTNVYGLVVRPATSQELARLGIRRSYGLIIVDIRPDSMWQGSRADQPPPQIGDVVLSGIGGGAWTDPAEFQRYASGRTYRVCVDARYANPLRITAFCRTP